MDNHPTSFAGVTPTPAWAFAQYQHVRATLPEGLPADQQPNTRALDSLAPLLEQFQVFVFDAFGVLNAGTRAFPSAIERIRQLQSLGKTVMILSNAATASHAALVRKYQLMGFAIAPENLVSSRWVLEQRLRSAPVTGRYGVLAPASSEPDTLPVDGHPVLPGTTGSQLDAFDGFIFLSSEGWNEADHDTLADSLKRLPRPVIVANPDLVAPRGDCLTLEPGFFAHRLMDQCDTLPEFFGKPYLPAFQAVLDKVPGIPAGDILMVGDTLHTDILGGQAAGMKTLLVTAEGSLKGMNIPDCIAQSGIAPDYVAPAI
ncbi:HAD hydrolase-like protein [Marinobacter daepoensis]|uniref:HAD hydrolase-like protein n=1 Tax=Marinobacter daepoensis TaxID=262077 RepID=A0ABS3B9Z7_9GAMM|nr:HAD hydrolase-like protein [Marinobacter daepoensis]MBN7768693.1 HAD hydrolase-like protein [Marinobacter daepoensis]MBY6032848.1 HAD hydrolase-like protein [Marinobacter daepoensis]MBY6079430.1 HAD hydrolase-like protein [Marinobacter daepoensis]